MSTALRPSLTIEARREVQPILQAGGGRAEIAVAVAEAIAELREEAVIRNGEGWQSGPIDHELSETGYDGVIHVRVWMLMQGHE